MFDSAKTMVIASLSELSGIELKCAVLERFYGSELDDKTRLTIRKRWERA